MLKIRRHPLFQRDHDGLESSELKEIARNWVDELALGNQVLGKPLGRVKGIGDLTGYWAIKFDLPGYHNRFRLVFRYLPNDQDPSEVYLLTIGPRYGYRVYRDASARISS